MAEPKTYWLISAPKTREDTFNTLNNRTSIEEPLSAKNYPFHLPELKVGTLDTLMSLSDDLQKADTVVEATTRKIAQQLMDLVDVGKSEKQEALTVEQTDIKNYLTFFQWSDAKYPKSTPLKTLVDVIQNQVAKIEDELKAKSSEYNNICNALIGEERKQGGNLLVKDLSDTIQKKHIIADSEFMQAVFVCVPKGIIKNWAMEYERLSDWVVPQSDELIAEDSDYQLHRVVIFKKHYDEFVRNSRNKKYIVREFTYDPNKNTQADKKKMETERDQIKNKLGRWCKSNFGEAFTAWIHLKAIRVFVESVLRYGLPADFQAMLLLPQKNKTKQLRKVLNDLYSHLTSKSVFSGKDADEVEEENFYPYVSLEVNLDFRKQVL